MSDHYYGQFRTQDLSRIFELVNAYPFARFLKNNDQTGFPDIVSAPVIVSLDGEKLEFHMANQNPAFENMNAGGKAVILISGPNAHISPAWYKDRFKDKPRSHTAPTWNYIEARIQCTIASMNIEGTQKHLARLVKHFENAETGWSFDEMNTDIFNKWSSHVTGFDVLVTRAEAILKLSDDQSIQDRVNIVEGLRTRNVGYDSMLADVMERII
jgi:transcriptional regulator